MSIFLSLNATAYDINVDDIYDRDGYLDSVPQTELSEDEALGGVDDSQRLIELLLSTLFSSLKCEQDKLTGLFAVIIFGTICHSFAGTSALGMKNTASVCIDLIIFIYIFRLVAEIYTRTIETVEALSTYTLTLSGVMVSFLAFESAVNSAGVVGSFVVALSSFLSFVSKTVLPLVCAFITVSAISSVTGKKMGGVCGMITGLYMSVFGGSLSLLSLLVSFQHRSALAGDSLLRRGAKIASAYAIPVVGGALSESLDNITLGLVTLKSSFGFGAALLIVLSLLPGIVSVILYRMVFILFSAFCEMADCDGVSVILRAFDGFFNVTLITLVLNSVGYLYAIHIFCEVGAI